MEAERYKTSYLGEIFIDFEPEAHEYAIGPSEEDLTPVPAVGDICNYTPKYLTAWGQGIGVAGVLELRRLAGESGKSFGDWIRGVIAPFDLEVPADPLADPKFIQKVMRYLQLDHDSVRQKAADRGSAVHSAYRGFILHGHMPEPDAYTGEVRGYIESLYLFCEAIKGKFETVLCEEPIASPSLGFAGTPDHLARFKTTRVQVGGSVGPRKRPKFEDISGYKLVDLKTSSQVYESHKWQLGGYDRAIQECGFEKPDESVIVLIKANGEGYNWKPQPDRSRSFQHLLHTWEADNREEGWSWSAADLGVAA